MPEPADGPLFIGSLLRQSRDRTLTGMSDAPRWTIDLSDEELAAVADDIEWWSGVHRRQAARELARRARERTDQSA